MEPKPYYPFIKCPYCLANKLWFYHTTRTVFEINDSSYIIHEIIPKEKYKI